MPQASDIVTMNGGSLRVEFVGIGDYAISVVSPEGGRFDLDVAELTLIEASRGYGIPAVWACWTDANGRRA